MNDLNRVTQMALETGAYVHSGIPMDNCVIFEKDELLAYTQKVEQAALRPANEALQLCFLDIEQLKAERAKQDERIAKLKADSDFDHSEYKRLRDELQAKLAMQAEALATQSSEMKFCLSLKEDAVAKRAATYLHLQDAKAAIESLKAKLAMQADAISPFMKIINASIGRIPVELLSFANWHDLVKSANATQADVDAFMAEKRAEWEKGVLKVDHGQS